LVRGDLEKIAGVADIITNVDGRECTFTVSDPDSDYSAKIAEFAKSNEHLDNYSIQ
jgi:hypothetical protein